MWTMLIAPAFAIFGVVIGASLNEFLRRRNRREAYAPKVFEKRLAAYEGLFQLIHDGGQVASELIGNAALTKGDRHLLVSDAIGKIAQYVDANALYLDEELSAHCTALFMGVEDIQDAPEADREALAADYYTKRRETVRMIAEDSGIAEVNKLFKAINKPNINGAIIERIRELRKLQR